MWKTRVPVLAALPASPGSGWSSQSFVLLGAVLVVVAATGGEDEEATGGPVTVPDVVGLPEDEAIARIDAAGLEPERELVAADTGADTVVEQEPNPGTEAAAGSSVLLRVTAEPGETDTLVVIETQETVTERRSRST